MNYETYRLFWDRTARGEKPAAPLHIDIELAGRTCDFHCTMCPLGSDSYRKEYQSGMMPTEMAKQIITEMGKLGIPAMKPNFRGEPLLHKGLEDILYHAHTTGMVDIRINTNANALTLPRAYTLKNLCDLIIVGKWERTVDNLAMLLDVPGKARVRVQMTVQKANEHQVETLRQSFEELGCEFTAPWAMDRGQGGKLVSGSRVATGRQICNHPFARMVIAWDGTVFGCCNSWRDEFVVGKYPDQSIMELWNSERMDELRVLAMNPDRAEPCKSCWVGTSYTWEEK